MSDYLALNNLSRSIDNLVKFTALKEAYAAAGKTCACCGLPATRYQARGGGFDPRCDGCPVPKPDAGEVYEFDGAPAVRRLMRIANVER